MSLQSMLDKTLVVMATMGKARKVGELLAQGGRVDAREKDFTPLLAAADMGHTQVCQLLLEKGSNLEERHPATLYTALHYAAGGGHLSLLQLLLSQGAEVNSRSRLEFTPLHMACQAGHLASVVTLLQAGADPLLPQVDGALPIHLAAWKDQSEVVKILIRQGRCSPDQVRHTALSAFSALQSLD